MKSLQKFTEENWWGIEDNKNSKGYCNNSKRYYYITCCEICQVKSLQKFTVGNWWGIVDNKNSKGYCNNSKGYYYTVLQQFCQVFVKKC